MGHRELDSDWAGGWHELLTSLAGLDGIAEWRLVGGVTFFMAIPDSSRLTDEGISDSTIRYWEIASIVVRATQPLGALSKANDLDRFREQALQCSAVQLLDDGESLTFRPHS